MRPKLFISYRRSQHAQVLAIKHTLDTVGVTVFLDTEAIEPLQNFPRRIAQAIGASHVLLAWWSRDYAESDHCLAEFKLAWQHARRRGPELARRLWVLNPEAGAGHVTAGELDACNFLRLPAPGVELAWSRALLRRLDALLAEGPLDDERNAPSAPGPLHRVPSGAEHFVGRNAELMRIHSLAHPPRIGDGARDVAVRTHGLGGVGKTELALQYARQFGAAYPGGVFWLRLAGFEPERYPAASRVEAGQAAWAEALLQCLEQDEVLRARLFDAAGQPLPPAAMRARIAAQFDAEPNRAFLWVLDNVPTLMPEDLRDELLAFWRAPGATGRTLLTTRDGAAMAGFQPLPLDVLGAEDALRLLALHRQPQDAAERQAAESLVEHLGRHPQALTLLARWIEMAAADQPYANAGARIAEAGALAHIETIADRLAPQLGAKARGIVAAFETSIAALDPDGRELLALAAVCAPNAAIPRGLLGAAFGTERADDGALAHLRRRGLLTDRSDGKAQEIHPLVAQAVLLLLEIDDAAGDELEGRIVQALLERLHDVSNSAIRDQLANDVGQALHFALRCESEASVRLGLRAGQYFHANGRFPQAARIERHALEQSRRMLGDEDRETLAAMNNLATTLQAGGDLSAARELQELGLSICRRMLGEDHPDTLTAIGNLANTFYAQGDLAGTRSLEESALAARRRILGEEHPDTLTSMNNLAATLKAQGDLAGARALHELEMSICRRVLGEEHPHTLISRGNLASTLKAQGDLAGARLLEEAILSMCRDLLGEEHPNTVTAMSNLAITRQTQGDLAGARELQESVLALRRRLLGEEHPDTLTSVSNLAETFRAEGDLASTRKLQELALARQRRILGEEHPDTLASMNNLAGTLCTLGDLAGARALHEQQLSICRCVLGEGHPDTLVSMNNFANTLTDQGDLAAARVLEESVLAERRRTLGADHLSTLTSMNNLAITLWEIGEHALALMQMRDAAEGRTRTLGPDHPHTQASRQAAEQMQAAIDQARTDPQSSQS